MRVGLLLLLVGSVVLAGCAVETPKAYFEIPNTGYSAYVYAGAGISKTADAAAAAK